MPEIEFQQRIAEILSLQQAGRLGEAETLCGELAKRFANHGGVTHLHGLLNHQMGRHEQAIRIMQRAISLNPADADCHNNLGVALLAAGHSEPSLAACRAAIGLRSNYPEAHNNAANALVRLGRHDEALAEYRLAVAQQPDFAQAQIALADTLLRLEHWDQAVAAYTAALELRPNDGEILFRLGAALRLANRPAEAAVHLRRALDLKPDSAEVSNFLGSALRESGHVQQAIAVHTQAVTRWPENSDAHFNLGFTHLLTGDFAQGLPLYEWRRQPRGDLFAAQWTGQDLKGKRIFLHPEQGLGDVITFARYIPLVAVRGATIILECYPELRRLLAASFDVAQIVSLGDPIPPIDFHCPLPSLPLVMQTRLETIPAPSAYLRADPAESQKWKSRLGPADGRLNIGLAWSGRPEQINNRNRSLGPGQLAPLAKIQRARFFRLQKSPAAEAGLEMIDWTADLHDLADTAAFMANLDQIITIDSAVAHLAGALGRTVWTLLVFAADWRWFLNRSDSPWYPTMRLFRQTAPGDWPSVISSVAAALEAQFPLSVNPSTSESAI